MTLSWALNPGDKEIVPNWERSNKFSDATVPLSGNTVYLTGHATECAGPLQYGYLYMIVSTKDCNIVSTTNPLLSATVYYTLWPGKVPYYHIPKSGSSDYISLRNYDGTNVEVWVSVVERQE